MYVKGVAFFQLKVYERTTFLSKWYTKGKGLDLRVVPPHIDLVELGCSIRGQVHKPGGHHASHNLYQSNCNFKTLKRCQYDIEKSLCIVYVNFEIKINKKHNDIKLHSVILIFFYFVHFPLECSTHFS